MKPRKWMIRLSKTGKRWMVWRSRSKKKTAEAFITWQDAINYLNTPPIKRP